MLSSEVLANCGAPGEKTQKAASVCALPSWRLRNRGHKRVFGRCWQLRIQNVESEFGD